MILEDLYKSFSGLEGFTAVSQIKEKEFIVYAAKSSMALQKEVIDKALRYHIKIDLKVIGNLKPAQVQ